MISSNLEQRLESIATNYHLKAAPDMFIERICQEFELNWLKKVIASNAKVLELGYGDGVTFEILAPQVDLTVVEGSRKIYEHAIAEASKKGLAGKIVLSYFENYDPSENYDYVFASHVLEHVDDPFTILERIKGWLSPGGVCIIIVPNKESIHRRVAVRMGLQDELDSLSPRDHAVGHLRVYSVSTMSELVTKAGMQILEVKGFFLKPLANSQLLGLEPSVIAGLCEVSNEIPPEYCANIAFVVKAL